jgi:uncharacterized membrane protein
MVDQNNKPRPAMGDIRPKRSMDMMRPSGASAQPMPQAPAPRPLPPRPVRPEPVAQAPIQRPQPIPQRPVAPRPALYAQAPQAAPAPVQQQKAPKPAKIRKERPFWRGLLQVIVSLLIIVGVAGVIVALYIRYYQ